MSRISPWRIRASGGTALAAAVFAVGCITGGSEPVGTRLISTPSSVMQGADTAVTISVPGFNLSACSDAAEAVEIVDPEGGRSVSVYRVDRLLLEPDSLRVYLRIEADAPTGTHAVTYRCDENSAFRGELQVTSVPEETVLSVKPDTLAAGSYGRTLMMTSEVPFFTAQTQFYFEYPDMVSVTHTRRIDSRTMEVRIDIQPLAPLGEMTVRAAEPGRFAAGTLSITDRVKAELSVYPTEAVRQGGDGEPAPVYELAVRADGIDLIGADEVEDPADATVLDFPENPGITVLDDMRVVELPGGEKELRAQIRVDSSAYLGSTPLHVSTGAQEAWDSFSVLLPVGAPFMRITSPSFVPRTGVPTPVFLEAVNFSFEDMQAIRCVPMTNCVITNVFIDRDTYSRMSLEVSVSQDTVVPEVTLVTVIPSENEGTPADSDADSDGAPSGQTEIPASLRVRDGDTAVIVLDKESVVTDRRISQVVTFSLVGEGEVFPGSVRVSVPMRSGIRVDGTGFKDQNPKELFVVFTVATDAPTGTAYVAIHSDGKLFAEVPLKVKRADPGAPQMRLSPAATLQKRDTVLVEVHASGFDLPEGPEGYRFDDPGLRVTEVYSDTPSDAALFVDVSPEARTDMAVLHAKSETGQAATTFRTLKYGAKEILTADPFEIAREGSSDTTYTVTVRGDGVIFDLTVVDVCDDIGVRIGKISAGQYLVFDMGVSPDPSYGGGWIGLNVKNGSERYLVPIYVTSGDDDSLSVVLNPNEVEAGTESVEITASLPEELSLAGGILEVQTDTPGVYASAPRIVSETEGTVRFRLDAARDVALNDDLEVKVFITVSNGVGVGVLRVSEVPVRLISVGGDWGGTLPPEETVRFRVDDVGKVPTLFSAGFAGAVIGDPMVRLTSDNKVDTADLSADGMLWVMTEQPTVVDVVSPDGAANAAVSVRSIGEGTVEESLWADRDWELTRDPCDTPFLGRSTIDGALDEDTVVLPHPACRLVVAAAARDLADRAWETPDLSLALSDAEGTFVRRETGRGYRDPVLEIDPDELPEALGAAVTISAELGTAGVYLLNIRRPATVREISFSDDTPFVELAVLPGMDLTRCELALIDIVTNQEVGRTPLATSDDAPDAGVDDTDGELPAVPAERDIFVVAGVDMPGADLVDDTALLPPEGDFALHIYYDGELLDAVQVGAVSDTPGHGEGGAIVPEDNRTVYVRAAGVDTNDNASDFVPTFIETPGY